MVLKPQDIIVALKTLVLDGQVWNLRQVAADLGLSLSEVHHAIRRLQSARLAESSQAQPTRPIRGALEEFLVRGLKYAFPPERGEPTRGMPTAYAAPPLDRLIVAGKDLPPVWPDPEGGIRGIAFSPLYRTAPFAARRDPRLYELLALVDSLRDGRARERGLARNELAARLRARAA